MDRSSTPGVNPDSEYSVSHLVKDITLDSYFKLLVITGLDQSVFGEFQDFGPSQRTQDSIRAAQHVDDDTSQSVSTGSQTIPSNSKLNTSFLGTAVSTGDRLSQMTSRESEDPSHRTPPTETCSSGDIASTENRGAQPVSQSSGSVTSIGKTTSSDPLASNETPRSFIQVETLSPDITRPEEGETIQSIPIGSNTTQTIVSADTPAFNVSIPAESETIPTVASGAVSPQSTIQTDKPSSSTTSQIGSATLLTVSPGSKTPQSAPQTDKYPSSVINPTDNSFAQSPPRNVDDLQLSLPTTTPLIGIDDASDKRSSNSAPTSTQFESTVQAGPSSSGYATSSGTRHHESALDKSAFSVTTSSQSPSSLTPTPTDLLSMSGLKPNANPDTEISSEALSEIMVRADGSTFQAMYPDRMTAAALRIEPGKEKTSTSAISWRPSRIPGFVQFQFRFKSPKQTRHQFINVCDVNREDLVCVPVQSSLMFASNPCF